MSLPTRKATSRHKSFSIKPVGPMVPVSCPPCPASITMRPIFRPKPRDKDCWPSRGVSGMEGGPISSAWSCADFEGRTNVVFAEVWRAFDGGGSELLPARTEGNGAVSGYGSVCAIWSLAVGNASDLDSVFLPRFLVALFVSPSRLGWGIGEEDWAMTLPFCVTSKFPSDVAARFGGVLDGAFDADIKASFSGPADGVCFGGPSVDALSRAASSAAVELP